MAGRAENGSDTRSKPRSKSYRNIGRDLEAENYDAGRRAEFPEIHARVYPNRELRLRYLEYSKTTWQKHKADKAYNKAYAQVIDFPNPKALESEIRQACLVFVRKLLLFGIV